MAKTKRPTAKGIKTAYGLLSAIRRLILEEPKRYNQGTWGEKPAASDPLAPACGTVGCVAGWTCALKAPRIFERATGPFVDFRLMRGVADKAQAILGLSQMQADALFHGGAAGRRHVWNQKLGRTELDLDGHAQRGAKHIAKFQREHAAQLRAKKV